MLLCLGSVGEFSKADRASSVEGHGASDGVSKLRNQSGVDGAAAGVCIRHRQETSQP